MQVGEVSYYGRSSRSQMTTCRINTCIAGVRKNYEDIEDRDEDVYCSIAVTKYILYLGFKGVGMNPEHPKVLNFYTFSVYYPSCK